MAKLVVKPIDKGLRNDRLAFNIDNDSFPTLINAYQWRGRIKRKRGTSFLARLTRFFNSTSSAYTGTTTNPSFTITFDGSGNANLFGPYTNATPISFSLQANGNIVPGSVSITGSVGPVTYTDPTQDGYLTPTGTGGPNTINYATGAIHIPAQAGGTATAHFLYYPDIPVMGLEEWVETSSQFPGTLGFDMTYSYNIPTVFPYNPYDISFYKNPAASAPYNYPSYVAKTTVTPTSWNGQDYQQFWSTNYQNAFWVTNGTNVPFATANIGMQFKPIVTVTVTSGGPPAIVSLQITGHGLVVGDFLFINEVLTTTGINWQTGYVITVTDANNVVVEFPKATIATNGTGGIAQYLTNRSDPTKDCIRWYDGDPTNGSSTTPVLNGGFGWVNFMPPLSRSAFSINDAPPAIYYLVGAKAMLPFKGRLLFFGVVIQASTGSPIYLQDTVVYSLDGPPFYTASFTGDVSAATTQFFPILTPENEISGGTYQTQSAFPSAYFGDQTGLGGNVPAGLDQPITTVNRNEDVIIVGFPTRQSRLVFTGDDILPFDFFTINSELGSFSTFSGITLDRGALTVGPNGIVLSSQVSTQRIDLNIPDEIFEFSLINNGVQRVTAQRDFINEWIYFTFCSNEVTWIYPNKTLQYNYRDESWAIFFESYTTYGQFRIQQDATWATIGDRFATWEQWNETWASGSSTLLQPDVIAGNQQGFIVFRDRGTDESNSLYIKSISGLTITSPNHNLNNGDYIVISGAIGMTNLNGAIFGVTSVTTNTFILSLAVGQAVPSGTYVGGGLIQRMYIPFIQTKQFPVAWDMAKKTRLGAQQYLLSTTDKGQISLLIFLSTVDTDAYNNTSIIPPVSENNSLIYSTVLYTCPESTNLGLTPANISLQMISDSDIGSSPQQQIWHRMNTSLIGDVVQIGITLNDAQMRDVNFNSQFAEIELHSFILDVQPSQLLA
jgi:hypothetical protein